MLQAFQGSDKAIINWEGFSIANGEITEFVQPGATSVALNRVVGASASAIHGQLKANGGVWVINQNGIFVGPTGRIDVASFIASTLDIADQDFLDGGDNRFVGTSPAGVVNAGTITAAQGDVFIIGHTVNNSGIIGAVDGMVGLAAGGDVLITAMGNERVFVNGGTGATGGTGVSNSGTITGAAAELKAHGNVYALAVNNSGIIRATGAVNENGRIILKAGNAEQGTGGNIENTGTMQARNPDGSGGLILVNSGVDAGVNIAAGELDASGVGDLPGGLVHILGQTIEVGNNVGIHADGGDGGTILIGSTDSEGNPGTSSVNIGNANITANGRNGNGGFVAVSGGAGSVLTSAGTIEANGTDNGGFVLFEGGTVNLLPGSNTSANGEVNGGTVQLIGDSADGAVNVGGNVSATGGSGTGGTILAQAANVTVTQTGVLDASGAEGGLVTLNAENGVATIDGTVRADGTVGAGGQVTVFGEEGVSVGMTGNVSANGATDGGLVSIDSPGNVMVEGLLSASGATGAGGNVNVTGDEVIIATTAAVNATGATQGGAIRIGGGFQGDDSSLRNSTSTIVGNTAVLDATASSEDGIGGSVVAWSDGNTIFNGEARTRTQNNIGTGGWVEVSGLQDLSFNGRAITDRLLLDPGDVNVGAAGSTITVATLNDLLQGENGFMPTDVFIVTESGSITFDSLGEGDSRDVSVLWNTSASLGVFASDNVIFNNSVQNAGSGSINVIAGWGGLEQDFTLAPGFFGDTTDQQGGDPALQIHDRGGLLDPETVFNHYVDNNQWGDGGSVFINDAGNNRGVAVGSRYGNTNVATQNLLMVGADSGGSRRMAQLGFVDRGMVFRADSGSVAINGFYDLNGNNVQDVGEPDVFMNETTAMYGEIGINEVTVGGQRGVQLFTNPNDPTGVNSVVEGSFLEYADHWGQAHIGTWWWRTLTDSTDGLGNNRPEHGAGTSATDRADINVMAKGAVILDAANGDGYAQIGHGGLADGGGSRTWNRSNTLPSPDLDENGVRYQQRVSINYVPTNNRFSASISRQAPVYSNISVRAGLTYNDVTGEFEATNPGGLVLVNADVSRYAQIGHLGAFQSAGEVVGDIEVEAGGDIQLNAANGWNGHAAIGHVQNAGETAQIIYDQDHIVIFNYSDTAFTQNITTTPVRRGDVVFNNLAGDIDVTSFGQNGIFLQGALGDELDAGNINWRSNGFGRGGRGFAGIGHGGGEVSDQQYSNAIGDIAVSAVNGDLTMIAGNQLRSYTHIGHGGYNWGHQNNSDFLVGHITIDVAGDIVVEGGGRIEPTYPLTNLDPNNLANRGNAFNETLANWSLIGHGGLSSNQQFKGGDINVNAGGNITVTGGAYAEGFAQIGHGGSQEHGQIGGSYTRQHESGQSGGATFSSDGSIEGTVDIGILANDTDMDPDNNLNFSQYESAELTVTAGGNITVNHLNAGDEDPGVNSGTNGDGFMDDPEGLDMDGLLFGNFNLARAYALIGHGGRDTDAINTNPVTNNDPTTFQDINANIMVTAGGDLIMEGGDNIGRSSMIGYGYQNDRSGGNNQRFFNGDVIVNVGNDLIMNAAAAGQYDQNLSPEIDPDTGEFVGNTTRENAVVIGSGGTIDNLWQNANGDVIVNVGNNLSMKAGNGLFASYVQIGHSGGTSAGAGSEGNDAASAVGDVIVTVGNDLTMAAGDNALIYPPVAGEPQFVEGAYARIGHGGHLMDNNKTGDVTVIVGNDLTMIAPNRTDQEGTIGGLPAGMHGNSVQIGHGINRFTGSQGVDGILLGDVYVEVANDLTIVGAMTPDDEDQPVARSHVQIGHGGPRTGGTRDGNIVVNVGNNLTVDEGNTFVGDNYVMVGNGDWMYATPSHSSTGSRSGDITVNVGESAFLSRTLIGNGDPGALGITNISRLVDGDVFFGVSRNNPFYGGTGTLTAQHGSVFASAFYGLGSEVRIYIPQRSLNLMDMTTRINEVTATYEGTPDDFAMPSSDVLGVQAPFQRRDEHYLQPDLWWDQGNDSPIPGSSMFAQGRIANVVSPGGFPNLVSFGGLDTNGDGNDDLGEGTAYYAAGNGVSGSGNYTLYYDAIEPVAALNPSTGGGGGPVGPGAGDDDPGVIFPPIVPPPFFQIEEPEIELVEELGLPFDLFDFLFLAKFETADQLTNLLNPNLGEDDDEEEEEEEEEEKRTFGGQVGNYTESYIYDILTGKYSSLRMFGTPAYLEPDTE